MHERDSLHIAVIGAGISGMVAAYHLSKRHEVTVFEAGNYIGGHTNTIRVELDNEVQQIDTGFIVFNEHNYPNFVALMNELGVASQPTCMSFSVQCERTGLEYNGTSPNKLFAQRRNLVRPTFWQMIREILRFGREAPALLKDDGVGPTVQQYVDGQGYSENFINHYLVPLGTALWSSPAATFRSFPMKFVVRFLANHCMLQIGGRPTWRVIKGGSSRYIDKLTAPYRDRIHLNCPVSSVQRAAGGVAINTRGYGSTWFDCVVFACHADQALGILDDATETEHELLSTFPYQSNQAVLHTDESVLPTCRRAWASWNAYVPAEDRDAVAVTYNMNMLQSLNSKHTFSVTLNDTGMIDEDKVIRRINYHHPVFTQRQAAAQERHGEVVNSNRTSFCGAYWGNGFHEDGVRSALSVCEAINSPVPGRGMAHA